MGIVGSSMPPKRDEVEAVLRAIRRVVRRISEHSRYLAREVGLTVPQLLCLKAIGDLDQSEGEPEITVAMVSKRVQLGAPTVSRIVDRLVRAQLVVRERRAQDRRKVCLSLTPAGLERYQTLPTPLQETFVSRFASLTDARRSAILSALDDVSAMMEASELDVAPVLVPGLDVRSED